MKNLKKAVAVTMVAGGIVAAGAGMASAHTCGAAATGAAHGSPGVVSGNVIQAPVDVPVNVVGNSINAVGVLNPAFGSLGLNN
ncbi:chaplin [Streptomyces shenzhenensis]|uniref:chaplin n=1 Tax=Streptomyces shenzhenensis TaxID=943815 RepID=UPI0015EFE335|nr:chaplin [Streptomyces shenzhenensis]